MTQELRLKLPPFEVDGGNIFGNDKLGREPEIKNLTRLIKTNASPLVMAVDSPWGTGKTVFIKLWAAHIHDLNKKGKVKMRALHFNAWETDFVADPLVSFLAAMEGQLSPDKQEGKASKPAQAKEWAAFIKKGKALLPTLMGVSAGIGAGWLGADASIAGGVGKTTQKAAEELAKNPEELAGNAVNSCGAQMKAIREFKGALAKYIKTSKQRIVIFVDELDRCRPDYAVKVLERIKHLFEVDGVTFVLAMDRRQLQHSVRGLYGARLDADKYLRRFIDFDYALQAPNKGAYWDAVSEALGVNAYFDKHGGNDKPLDMLRNTFFLLDKIYGLSLRDAEQLLLRINLVLCSMGDIRVTFPEFLAFLLVIREKDPQRYVAYRAPGGEEQVVADWEQKIKNAHIAYDGNMIMAAGFITAWLSVTKHAPKGEHCHAQRMAYNKKLNNNNLPKWESEYIKEVCNGMSYYIKNFHLEIFDLLTRKIELLDQFNFVEYADSGEQSQL